MKNIYELLSRNIFQVQVIFSPKEFILSDFSQSVRKYQKLFLKVLVISHKWLSYNKKANDTLFNLCEFLAMQKRKVGFCNLKDVILSLRNHKILHKSPPSYLPSSDLKHGVKQQVSFLLHQMASKVGFCLMSCLAARFFERRECCSHIIAKHCSITLSTHVQELFTFLEQTENEQELQ